MDCFVGFFRDSNECVHGACCMQRKPASDWWSAGGMVQVNQMLQDVLYWASTAPIGRREPHEGIGDRLAQGDDA